MKISVDITDLGPDLSTSTLRHEFEMTIGSRFDNWKKGYSLKRGRSLKRELKVIGDLFDRELRGFVVGSVDSACGSPYQKSIDFKEIPLKRGETTISGHRYLPIVLSVCDELAKGFNNPPERIPLPLREGMNFGKSL
jgi:hypothetical protein